MPTTRRSMETERGASRASSKEKTTFKTATVTPVRNRSTKTAKKTKEEKIRDLLRPVGADPPPDALNIAKRIVDLETEISQAKKSKKPELTAELEEALTQLQEIK